MKRFLIVCTTLGLLVGAVATAEAAKRTKGPTRVERTVEGTYDAPFVPMLVSCDWSGLSWGCVDVHTQNTEAFFTAKATDAHGLPVVAAVYSYNENGRAADYGTFCGETTKPMAIEPGVKLRFVVGPHWLLPAPSCPSGQTATTGTISVTLSNLP